MSTEKPRAKGPSRGSSDRHTMRHEWVNERRPTTTEIEDVVASLADAIHSRAKIEKVAGAIRISFSPGLETHYLDQKFPHDDRGRPHPDRTAFPYCRGIPIEPMSCRATLALEVRLEEHQESRS